MYNISIYNASITFIIIGHAKTSFDFSWAWDYHRNDIVLFLNNFFKKANREFSVIQLPSKVDWKPRNIPNTYVFLQIPKRESCLSLDCADENVIYASDNKED